MTHEPGPLLPGRLAQEVKAGDAPARPRRDLLWIIVLVAPIFVALARIDIFETYRSFVQRHGLSVYQADDVVFLFIFLSVALALFSYRRWRELKKEIQVRRRAERLKDQFLATMSHELRTPLTTIRESVSQIHDGLLGDVSDMQKTYLVYILDDVDRLTRLINNTLDLSKLESGAPMGRRTHLDMNAMVKRLVTLFGPEAQKKGLSLRIERLPEQAEILADPDQLTQIWSNLIHNALKFTATGGVILEVEDTGQDLRCRVTDTGFGIPEDALPHIFTRFYQYRHQQEAGDKGTGLGLTIVRSLVEAQGGHISVQSTPGQGTRFEFILPKAPL